METLDYKTAAEPVFGLHLCSECLLVTSCEVVQFFVAQFVNVLLTLVLHVSPGVAVKAAIVSSVANPFKP